MRYKVFERLYINKYIRVYKSRHMDKVLSLIISKLAQSYKIQSLFGNIIPVLKSLNKEIWFRPGLL